MQSFLWQSVQKPIVALAPMDGYTDSAFRRICKRINQSLVVFTEFTAADGLLASERLWQRLRFFHDEQPIIAQLFGSTPMILAEAAKRCEALGFSGIDINMGCPSRHIVRSEQGVALRNKPDRAFRYIDAVARAVSIPVSVKTRLGISDAHDLVSFGIGCMQAGASLITVHGRTYNDGYRGPARFEAIYDLQREVRIPVLVNGGILSLDDGNQKIGPCAGFMIGQAALGNPWAFSVNTSPLPKERISLIHQHCAWMVELYGETHGCLLFRKHLIRYTRGIRKAVEMRRQCAHIQTLDDCMRVLNEILKQQ